MNRPPLRPPPFGTVWWSDGTHVRPLTPEEISAWLERGVAHGWVVVAQTAEKAHEIGTKLFGAAGKLDKRT